MLGECLEGDVRDSLEGEAVGGLGGGTLEGVLVPIVAAKAGGKATGRFEFRRIDGRFLAGVAIGMAGTAGDDENDEAEFRFGDDCELYSDDGGDDRYTLVVDVYVDVETEAEAEADVLEEDINPPDVDDLNDPAMVVTMDGFRLRLMGCAMSGIDCVRSGVKVYDEPTTEDGSSLNTAMRCASG